MICTATASCGRLKSRPTVVCVWAQARYTALFRTLLEEGCIEEIDQREGATLGEERRRYYRLTSMGRKLARSEAERLASLTLRVARTKKIFRGTMSEKIYSPLLLRLYPSNFQKAYGEDALQLFRDRARDERGFLSGLRLWIDLLADLLISIPREHRAARTALAASRTQPCFDGTPSFRILEDEAPSFVSLVNGGVAAMVIYASLLLLARHAGNALPFGTSDLQRIPRHSASAKLPPTLDLSYLPVKPSPRINLSLPDRNRGSTRRRSDPNGQCTPFLRWRHHPEYKQAQRRHGYGEREAAACRAPLHPRDLLRRSQLQLRRIGRHPQPGTISVPVRGHWQDRTG